MSRVATGRPRRPDPAPAAVPRGPDRRPRTGRSHRPLSVLPLVALFVLMRRQVMRSLGAIVAR